MLKIKQPILDRMQHFLQVYHASILDQAIRIATHVKCMSISLTSWSLHPINPIISSINEWIEFVSIDIFNPHTNELHILQGHRNVALNNQVVIAKAKKKI